MFALTTLLPSRLTPSAAQVNTALDLPALVGAAGWSRLPAAVQRRFGIAHADVTYEGLMDLRCSSIGHIYAALARVLGGPLTHLNTNAMPTTVRVSDNGHGGVIWERCFHTGAQGHDRTVRSTKELGADGGLLERTDGGLSMSLDVFEEAGALVFQSRRFWLVWGRLRLPVPALLTPGTCRVAHTDLGEGLFRFTLSMVHPLWGETFHQTGVFADPTP
ncbi:DUF4166 domain-containing protein [Rhodoferax sp. AJA081-3]|uniref:DUF4166 domain-containing protein n=1 Tax=Rhodoferax sp. AJA081-3 TaxID=2752316 RepID=UPI001AE04CE2|nr:DUF4166 domain-containing protein [Rhodoferax sp. AJA081-3]QTN26943.1 DUF4166 domain-containing protein [Rhodoferax sp. AJA081-3]